MNEKMSIKSRFVLDLVQYLINDLRALDDFAQSLPGKQLSSDLQVKRDNIKALVDGILNASREDLLENKEAE